MVDDDAPKKGKKPIIKAELIANCGNCEWGKLHPEGVMVDCQVSFPPQVQLIQNAKRYRVHKSYRCFAWKHKQQAE